MAEAYYRLEKEVLLTFSDECIFATKDPFGKTSRRLSAMEDLSLLLDVMDLVREKLEQWRRRHQDPVVEETRRNKEALAKILQRERQTVAR